MWQRPYAGESQIVEDEFSELKAESLVKGKKRLNKNITSVEER